MSRTFLLLQLAFNIVMLLALVALAWRRRGRVERRQRKSFALVDRREAPQGRAAAALDAPAPTGELTELVEQAERRELLAERALRARLAEFRARAAS